LKEPYWKLASGPTKNHICYVAGIVQSVVQKLVLNPHQTLTKPILALPNFNKKEAEALRDRVACPKFQNQYGSEPRGELRVQVLKQNFVMLAF
jgi:hypothetical protein